VITAGGAERPPDEGLPYPDGVRWSGCFGFTKRSIEFVSRLGIQPVKNRIEIRYRRWIRHACAAHNLPAHRQGLHECIVGRTGPGHVAKVFHARSIAAPRPERSGPLAFRGGYHKRVMKKARIRGILFASHRPYPPGRRRRPAQKRQSERKRPLEHKDNLAYYIHDGADAFRFRLAGTLSENSARDLEIAWNTASSVIGRKRVIIDLTDLTGIEVSGQRLLALWHTRDARLVVVSEKARLRLALITAQPIAVATSQTQSSVWRRLGMRFKRARSSEASRAARVRAVRWGWPTSV
jgi:hypothetical protein